MDADYYRQSGLWAGRYPGLEAVLKISEQCNRFQVQGQRFSSAISLERNDFSIKEAHGELEIYIKKLLHTRMYESDKFCLIVTKQGKFEIEYAIMCEEFEEPQTGTFEVTVDV